MLNKALKNNRGSSLIGALITITALGFLGTAVATQSAGDQEVTTNAIAGSQAFYISQAGLEYAKRELDYGNDPNGITKDVGFGSFEIETDATTDRITVNATYGQANKTQSIGVTFSDDIHSLNTESATSSGSAIENISVVKDGHSQSIISQIKIDWNYGSCEGGAGDAEGEEECDGEDNACDTDNDGDVDYSDFADPDHDGKIMICHVAANGNEGNLSVAVSGWEGGHDGHDNDYLGACGGPDYCELTDDSGDNGDADCGGGNENYDCPENDHDHGGTYVTSISLGGTTIFSGGNAASGGATQTIDVSDFILTSDGSYDLDLNFNDTLPANAWYEVTLIFADGTEVSSALTF